MFILIAVFFVIIAVLVIYFNSNYYINKLYTKKLKHLINNQVITEEEFNILSKKTNIKILNIKKTNENKNKLNIDLEKIKSKDELTGEKSGSLKSKIAIHKKNTVKIVNKTKHHTISILLYLGVTLIVIAGVVFATTTWSYLPGGIKAVLLFSFSGMLFGTSIFLEKEFGIQKTSFALWILGTIFLPITCIATGYLEVFGNYFSINSEGRYLFALVSSIICLPIYIISIKKYLSKTFIYMAGINFTLISFFAILNVSTNTDIVIIMMSLYNLIILNICAHIVNKKTKLRENVLNSMHIISKITLVIITIITVLNTVLTSRLNINIFNVYNKIDIMNLLSFVIIIGNYIYICMKKKDYIFSVLTTITLIAFFNNIYFYLIQKNILKDVSYLSFMFVVIAIVCLTSEVIRVTILNKIKHEGFKILVKIMTLIYIPILASISISYIIQFSNKSYEVLIFSAIVLILLIQKRLSYKRNQTILTKAIDVLICTFSMLTLFCVYRYFPISLNVNLIVYISAISFVPWLISKAIDIFERKQDLKIYKVFGTIFLIIPFVLSFVEINSSTAIFKICIAIFLVIVWFYNYFDFIKKYISSVKLELITFNLNFILLFAPIYIALIAWLNIIPSYCTLFISGGLIYLITLLDKKRNLLEKLKYYILATIILSDFSMIIYISNIFEFIAIQLMLLMLYLNKEFRNDLFYSTFMMFALVINLIFINSTSLLTGKMLSILNITMFVLITLINVYSRYEIKKIKNNDEILLKQKKFILSTGITLSLVPYMQVVEYIFKIFNVPEIFTMIFAEVPLIFSVFIIEKMIYKKRNIATYIIQTLIYFIALFNIVESNDVLIYSIMLMILLLIGLQLKNKSMFLVPSIFLMIFVIKESKEFWLSIPWWLYLFIGGGLLVYFAMKREIYKQNPVEVKKTNVLKEFFSNFED